MPKKQEPETAEHMISEEQEPYEGKEEESIEAKEILKILHDSSDSIFITGKAGTGKSTLLRKFRKETKKNIVVLAPTGIAAINVNGQTIHSFFKFPPTQIKSIHVKVQKDKESLFRELDALVIDEVSMVRADLMDAIDLALKKNRKSTEPFGGVQMIFIGDLFQLPPVVRREEMAELMFNFDGVYFFNSKVFRSFRHHHRELSKVYRQDKDQSLFQRHTKQHQSKTGHR